MSYSIHLSINTGNHDALIVEVGNYTANVSGMWATALGRPLYELDGMIATEAIPLLVPAIEHMKSNPDIYKPMNPENGWGNYEGALDILESLLTCCQEHPLTKLDIGH